MLVIRKVNSKNKEIHVMIEKVRESSEKEMAIKLCDDAFPRGLRLKMRSRGYPLL